MGRWSHRGWNLLEDPPIEGKDKALSIVLREVPLFLTIDDIRDVVSEAAGKSVRVVSPSCSCSCSSSILSVLSPYFPYPFSTIVMV